MIFGYLDHPQTINPEGGTDWAQTAKAEVSWTSVRTCSLCLRSRVHIRIMENRMKKNIENGRETSLKGKGGHVGAYRD